MANAILELEAIARCASLIEMELGVNSPLHAECHGFSMTMLPLDSMTMLPQVCMTMLQDMVTLRLLSMDDIYLLTNVLRYGSIVHFRTMM
jgi:hypothetical protein